MIALSAAGAGAMLYMQARFDRGEQQSAILVTRNYRAPSGRSLRDAIAARHPGSPEPEWTARTESACFGHERVRAEVVTPQGKSVYEFLVDINRLSIHPGSESGQRVLEDLNR